ncbi:MAG: hypothetical protein PHE89_05880 [Alphaproteobacteria bacterium]|nr:hypothetical protein [Alphaproteobacteria bacterium]
MTMKAEIIEDDIIQKPTSLFIDKISALKILQNKYEYLAKAKTKTKNTKKIYSILMEIREIYFAQSRIKLEITKSLQIASQDEKILTSLLQKKTKDFNKIGALLKKHDLIYAEEPYFPLNKIEKDIIAADYKGIIRPVDYENLSDFYKTYRGKEEKPQYELSEYALENSKAWALFAQFKNFKILETCVKRHLQELNIPPQKIKKLVIEDFADILHLEQSKQKKPLFLGQRKSFIKDFIKKNEQAFRLILQDLKVDPRYINALVTSMKKNGVCENIVVYNNKGEKIRGPNFSVHHKTPVKDGHSKDYLAEVNLFKNLCLCIDMPYHKRMLHMLDRTNIDDQGNITKTGISFKNEDIVFMAGLSPLHQIYYDYDQDSRTKRAVEKLHQHPQVNLKIKAEPNEALFDNYEKRMKAEGKTPINYRAVMKIRESKSNY